MMKSILYPSLLIALLILLVQPMAQAQKHCDLALNIYAPAHGAEIPFGDTVKMHISVKNLGPDDIDSSDAFVFKIEGFPFGTNFSNNIIAVGDSIVYVPYYTLNGRQDTNYNLVLCASLEVTSNTFVDEYPLNDSACMNVILKAKNPTAISPLYDQIFSFQIYPNPAKDKVVLQMKLNKKEELFISIQNILGHTTQEELIKADVGENELSLNIAHLSSGIYFMKIVNEIGKVWVQKLLIE